MLLSTDFRAMARDALRGKWLSAALIGLLAGLLGANIFGGASFNVENRYEVQLDTFFHSSLWLNYRIFFIIGGGVLVLYVLVLLVIGGAATLGYARYNLNLVDHRDARVDDLFSQFHRLGQGFCMQFFRGLFTFLWSLLFCIPGIIKAYAYSMAYFVKADHPEYGWNQCLKTSIALMKGNKWRLFVLDLSFIGWYLVGALCLGIGTLWVTPYHQAAHAQFYCGLTRTQPAGCEEPRMQNKEPWDI